MKKVVTITKCGPHCPQWSEAFPARMWDACLHISGYGISPIPKDLWPVTNKRFPDWCPLQDAPED